MQSLRTKLILCWVAFAALLITATNLIAFRTALDAQFQQLRHTLTAMAATGALSIDGDEHAQIPRDPASRSLPAYRGLLERLRAIRQANPTIRYVYTLVPSERSDTWSFIGDTDEEDPALPGEPYEVSRYPAMLAALQGPSADSQLTTDAWGVFLSGYAPIRNRAGHVVGVLGVDMAADEVARTQTALRQWRIAILIIGLITVLVLGVLIAQWVTRPLQRLVQATRSIGQGDFEHRVPIHSHDETGLLAQAFNQMAELLSTSRQQLQEHLLSTIQSLAAAIEMKDRYTRGHSERVLQYAVKIAKRLRLPEAQVDLIRKMAVLHDVGKIGVKEEILLKPAKLTPEEFLNIVRHPELGYKILAPLNLPKEALEIVRHHHERVDGGGYPAGLKGEEIPRSVAIVAVADAFDAMTAHRPYRPTPLTFVQAAEELKRCGGTQFRSDVVDALLDVLRQEGKLLK